MSTDDGYRYANVYFRYGSEYVGFDSDLDILAGSAQYRSDEGDGTEGEFYERVNGDWMPVDVTALMEAARRAEYARWDERAAKASLTPFKVRVCGPGDTTEWAHSAATFDSADEWARENLPADMKYKIERAR